MQVRKTTKTVLGTPLIVPGPARIYKKVYTNSAIQAIPEINVCTKFKDLSTMATAVGRGYIYKCSIVYCICRCTGRNVLGTRFIVPGTDLIVVAALFSYVDSLTNRLLSYNLRR